MHGYRPHYFYIYHKVKKNLIKDLVLVHFTVFLFTKEKKSSYETIGCINYGKPIQRNKAVCIH